MKKIILLLALFVVIEESFALTINEIMSNPVGDDSGREWLEIYNETTDVIDLSTLTISIKGGNPVSVTPVSGGTLLSGGQYAIVGSTVSGATKFSIDYPTFTGPLLRSSISLVNTGITSIDIRLQGSVVAQIPSYTGAKEGETYSHINGTYSAGVPTPGKENQSTTSINNATENISATGTANQVTIPQMSPPQADMILYLPSEKKLVAGAESVFKVYATTFTGKEISNMTYKWSFGEGGQKTGSSTLYRYLYPGKYIVNVEGSNGIMAASAKMTAFVFSPQLYLSSLKNGKYGKYIIITNPNEYEVDISAWKLVINEIPFVFPENTILGRGDTIIPGNNLGFSSTTISAGSIIKLAFPTNDEVVRTSHEEASQEETSLIIERVVSTTTTKKININLGSQASSSKKTMTAALVRAPIAATTSSSTKDKYSRDTRLATFLKNLFK